MTKEELKAFLNEWEAEKEAAKTAEVKAAAEARTNAVKEAITRAAVQARTRNTGSSRSSLGNERSRLELPIASVLRWQPRGFLRAARRSST